VGIMARKRDEAYVIASDRGPDGVLNKRAARNLSNTYHVWTGDCWTAVMSDAKTFETEEAAEDYIRANADQVMKYG
jgi:hypothetical protein